MTPKIRKSLTRAYLALALSVAVEAGAATFTVTSTADSGPGSLRAAIINANASAGPDAIHFAIAGNGVQTIRPMSELPAITDRLQLDGCTQPGYAHKPLIDLQGQYSAAVSAIQLEPGSDGSEVRCLVIHRFYGFGIRVRSNGNTIAANYIGTDVSGSSAEGNAWGGVVVESGSDNTIGGMRPGDGNLISGNDIDIALAVRTRVVGNFIGTDATGSAIVGESFNLVDETSAQGTIVGGSDPGARNVIAGRGITMLGRDGIVVGNFIGVDVTGTRDLTLQLAGVEVGGTNNRIGGPGAERNVILGGAGGAVQFSSGRNHSAINNAIGVEADGHTPLKPGYGVVVRRATGVTIGGTSAGLGNFIACGSSTAVVITDAAEGIEVRGNTVLGAGRRIDLAEDGRTPNDSTDSDSGPNGLQNYPVLIAAQRTASGTKVGATLDSTPAATFTIDIYGTDPCVDCPVQQEQWIGATDVTTDSNGHAEFVYTAAFRSQYISATATSATHDTSEFSEPLSTAANVPATTPVTLIALAAGLAVCALRVLRA